MNWLHELISAFREMLRLVEQVFPLPAIVAAIVFVVGMIWYSLRGRKQ